MYITICPCWIYLLYFWGYLRECGLFARKSFQVWNIWCQENYFNRINNALRYAGKNILPLKLQKRIRNGIKLAHEHKSGVRTPKTICVKWGNKSEDALITSYSNSVFIQFSLLGEVLKSVRLTSKSPEPSQPSSSSPPFEISVTGQSDTPSHLK